MNFYNKSRLDEGVYIMKKENYFLAGAIVCLISAIVAFLTFHGTLAIVFLTFLGVLTCVWLALEGTVTKWLKFFLRIPKPFVVNVCGYTWWMIRSIVQLILLTTLFLLNFFYGIIRFRNVHLAQKSFEEWFDRFETIAPRVESWFKTRVEEWVTKKQEKKDKKAVINQAKANAKAAEKLAKAKAKEVKQAALNAPIRDRYYLRARNAKAMAEHWFSDAGVVLDLVKDNNKSKLLEAGRAFYEKATEPLNEMYKVVDALETCNTPKDRASCLGLIEMEAQAVVNNSFYAKQKYDEFVELSETMKVRSAKKSAAKSDSKLVSKARKESNTKPSQKDSAPEPAVQTPSEPNSASDEVIRKEAKPWSAKIPPLKIGELEIPPKGGTGIRDEAL